MEQRGFLGFFETILYDIVKVLQVIYTFVKTHVMLSINTVNPHKLQALVDNNAWTLPHQL